MDIKKEFTKCPVCALREDLADILGKPELKLGDGQSRFCSDIIDVAKERGLAKEDFNFFFQYLSGVAAEASEAQKAKVGTEAPSYAIGTDICTDCGCVYAATLTIGEEKKPSPPPKMIVPNRAQRRHTPPINPFSKS